jgi:chromosome segregation ATPase
MKNLEMNWAIVLVFVFSAIICILVVKHFWITKNNFVSLNEYEKLKRDYDAVASRSDNLTSRLIDVSRENTNNLTKLNDVILEYQNAVKRVKDNEKVIDNHSEKITKLIHEITNKKSEIDDLKHKLKKSDEFLNAATDKNLELMGGCIEKDTLIEALKFKVGRLSENNAEDVSKKVLDCKNIAYDSLSMENIIEIRKGLELQVRKFKRGKI